MTRQRWVLLDAGGGIWHEQLQLGASDLGQPFSGCEIACRRLRGGLSDGVDMVRLQCGELAVEVLPTRGMGIWKAWLGGEEIGWQSPNRGPVHPQFVPLSEPDGLGWLDGFDELLVRCGLESNGAPDFDAEKRLIYPLHGRIANRPAHHVEVSADAELGELSITGVVEETRVHFVKLRLTSTLTLRLGEPAIRIRDQVQNFSGGAAEMQMLYHINFGPPWVDPGARFVAPVARVVPRDARAAEGIGTWNRYAEPQAGYSEEVYFLDLTGDREGMSQALLKNASQERGVSIHFNRSQLPCFTLWKNTITAADGYATGLEPGTNFPNRSTFERQHGRVVPLASGATADFDLRLEFHRGQEAVRDAEAAIESTGDRIKPEMPDRPQPNWCVLD